MKSAIIISLMIICLVCSMSIANVFAYENVALDHWDILRTPAAIQANNFDDYQNFTVLISYMTVESTNLTDDCIYQYFLVDSNTTGDGYCYAIQLPHTGLSSYVVNLWDVENGAQSGLLTTWTTNETSVRMSSNGATISFYDGSEKMYQVTDAMDLKFVWYYTESNDGTDTTPSWFNGIWYITINTGENATGINIGELMGLVMSIVIIGMVFGLAKKKT